MYAQQCDYEKEIEELLKRMTLEEKIGQMNQVNFDGLNDGLLRRVEKGEIGSFLNVTDSKAINILQKAAEKSKHKIPLIIARDVIHGYKTIFLFLWGKQPPLNRQWRKSVPVWLLPKLRNMA